MHRFLERQLEKNSIIGLEESFNSHLNAIIKAMPDLMFLNDENGKFLEVFVSDDVELYVSKENLLGKHYNEIFSEELANFFHQSIKKAIKKKSLNIIEYDLKIYNKLRHYEARIMPVGLSIDNKETVIVITRNMTKAKKIENRLKYIAMHDSLTKLPNRYLFQKRLRHAIKKAKKENGLGALFFLDIDRFKEINDNLGHDIGDKLLVKCARRLKNVLRADDTLARFGGDEFVIIIRKITSHQEVIEIAQSIMRQFIEPFKINPYLLNMTTSMGITIFPSDGDKLVQLVKQTDIAMYHAKSLGRDNYQFFTEALAKKAEVNSKKFLSKSSHSTQISKITPKK